ncbi:unnamed protein product [Boreogadus saida]
MRQDPGPFPDRTDRQREQTTETHSSTDRVSHQHDYHKYQSSPKQVVAAIHIFQQGCWESMASLSTHGLSASTPPPPGQRL